MKKKKPTRPRRPYQTPELHKVRIRLDEALLVSCKIDGSRGPSGFGCGANTTPCSDITS